MRIKYVDAKNLKTIQQNAPDVAMVFGYFDGVHIGHQKVILEAKKQAQKQRLALAVLSFFPHPKSVLKPEKEVFYIEPIEQKAKKLAKLGVDIFYVVQFTTELASLSPTIFLDEYVLGLHAKQVICGFDYTYGQNASGTVETLAVYAATQQIGCTVVPEFLWKKQKVSSTRIRECIQAGKLQEIPLLLGTYHTTKYCLKDGVLPYSSLPRKGKYQIFIDTGQELIPGIATVLSEKKVQLHCEEHTLPPMVTIQWIDDLNANHVSEHYA